MAAAAAAAAVSAAPRSRIARTHQEVVGLEGEGVIGGNRHNEAGDVGRVCGDVENRRFACREMVPGASGLARCRNRRSDLEEEEVVVVVVRKSQLENARLLGPVGAS